MWVGRCLSSRRARIDLVVPAEHLHGVPLGIRVALLDLPNVAAELVRNDEDLTKVLALQLDPFAILGVETRQSDGRLECIANLAAVPNRPKLGVALPLKDLVCADQQISFVNLDTRLLWGSSNVGAPDLEGLVAIRASQVLKDFDFKI